MWSKRRQNAPSRIERRVERLSTAELAGWADQALYAIGSNLSQWQRSGDSAALEEASLGAEALQVVLKTIKTRTS